MCCCGKPTINGTLGYKWQPNDTPQVREAIPPAIASDEVLLFDEPGRCGGIDSHSHHYRLVKHYSRYILRVAHGGGEDCVQLSLYGNGFKEMITALDSNTRYWLLNEFYRLASDARREGEQNEAAKWRKAAAEKRIKTRKVRGSNQVRVTMEPEQRA